LRGDAVPLELFSREPPRAGGAGRLPWPHWS